MVGRMFEFVDVVIIVLVIIIIIILISHSRSAVTCSRTAAMFVQWPLQRIPVEY
jgi:uncharacterized integral membrane protein